ncbi:MAG: Trp biosynthesis-associated membrane protein [Longispora sp.]|nr:Trp biosynthesis-associated membrane protein [Longispora sp. (in: high G+C Gram-positive bacteria)]
MRAERGRTPGREFGLVALATILAAALSLWGVSRAWWVMSEARLPPLPPREVIRTGWSGLTACGLVALAAVGALWATRGFWRRLVGLLLLVSGVVLVSGGLAGLWSATNVVGPLSTCVSGLVVLGCGGAVVSRGSRWPTMGMRYERSVMKNTDLWGALDHGEDPTCH